MSDLISRQDALCRWNEMSERGRAEFDQELMMMPSAKPDWNEILVMCDNCGHAIHVRRENIQIPERKTGKWLRIEIIDDDSEHGVNDEAAQCSECQNVEGSYYWATTYHKFCPNCGCKMEVQDDE